MTTEPSERGPLTIIGAGPPDTSDPNVARYLKDIQEPHLYHYTSATALLNIVKTRAFWASRTDFTNDRLEAQHVKERLRNMVENPDVCLPWASSTNRNHLAALWHQLSNDRVACFTSFSRHADSLTQFRMYGPPAGGYAIGFPRYFLDGIGPLIDCDYSRDRMEAWCHSYIQDFVAQAARVDDGRMSAQQIHAQLYRTTDLFTRRINAQLTFKSTEFRAEDEARLCRFGLATNWRISADGNAVVPYEVFELPNEPVAVHVVCGPNRDPAFGGQSVWTIMDAARAAGTLWQFRSEAYTSKFRA
jgi:hypothetical protein